MISQPVDEFLVYLVGGFAALLWLRPGRREAIRYAMILLSAGVLYALLMQEAAGWQYQVLLHVKHSVSLILFLLGVYMLKCPWRQVVLSLGVFSLVASGIGIALACIDLGGYDYSVAGIIETVCLDYAYVWLFIWLCARKSGNGGKWTALLAAGAFYSVGGMATGNLRAALALGNYVPWLHVVVNALSLFFVLYWVLQQTRRRSIVTTVLYILPAVCSTILLWVYCLP